MTMSEDVRALIIEEPAAPRREKLYTSAHHNRVLEEEAGRKLGAASTMGRHVDKPDPRQFLKKTTPTETKKPGDVGKFQYNDPPEYRKPAVPSRKEEPVYGLVSNKNFITANAIENILAAPKRPKSENPIYLTKKDFGRIPDYLERNKKEIEKEKEMIRKIHQQQQDEIADRFVLLTADQRKHLLKQLKDAYERTLSEFQTLPVILDTDHKRARKEALEAKLAGIEKKLIDSKALKISSLTSIHKYYSGENGHLHS